MDLLNIWVHVFFLITLCLITSTLIIQWLLNPKWFTRLELIQVNETLEEVANVT